MFTSIETRWFLKGNIPENILSVYQKPPGSAIKQQTRTDYYLVGTNKNFPGIKWREGRIEIKHKTKDFGKFQFAGEVTAYVDQWVKWSFKIDEAENYVPKIQSSKNQWIGIKKERWLKFYEFKDGLFKAVQTTDNLANACAWELGKVAIDGWNEKWWTIGFEAFGTEIINNPKRFSNVISAWLNNYTGKYLCLENAFSYPSWFSKINSK